MKTKFKPGSGLGRREESPHRKREPKEKETDENAKHRGRRKHRESNGKPNELRQMVTSKIVNFLEFRNLNI